MRRLLAFIICIVVSTITLAQMSTSKFQFGFEGGMGITKFYGNSTIRQGTLPNAAYAANGFFQYNFNKLIGLKIGLGYDRKGFSISTERLLVPPLALNIKARQYYRFNYWSIPVMAHFMAGTKKIYFFADCGPYLSILLRADATVPYTNTPIRAHDITANYKPIDLGIALGIGLIIPIRQFGILFDIRNNVGLLHISRYADSPIATYSTVFMLGFEYRFKSKSK